MSSDSESLRGRVIAVVHRRPLVSSGGVIAFLHGEMWLAYRAAPIVR